jgi:hypothetical protein
LAPEGIEFIMVVLAHELKRITIESNNADNLKMNFCFIILFLFVVGCNGFCVNKNNAICKKNSLDFKILF